MKDISEYTLVTKGAFNKAVKQRIVDFLASCEGKYVRITITQGKKRSLEQNSYIHGILIPEFKKALNECGWDDIRTLQQCKDYMKKEFLTYSIINTQTGEYKDMIKNTSDLTTSEMTDFINTAIKYAQENMNYRIYAPNEQSEFINE